MTSQAANYAVCRAFSVGRRNIAGADATAATGAGGAVTALVLHLPVMFGPRVSARSAVRHI